eukprot:TRINITY_DN8709_c0_g1_i1.p1 TRINITY_DN8709_c0_g1~~TRINITY_DN8709_c0_g1_i1.p1  ORF type:complete len:453 (+),score=94.68 TRINITY_DN8709_c0_g1_i1:103-1461(+)
MELPNPLNYLPSFLVGDRNGAQEKIEKAMDLLPTALSQEKNLVDRVTTNDDQPPSGYILDQIASATFKSMSSCKKVVDVTCSKLTESSPNVRWKVLKLIRYLLEKGERSYRIQLQQNSELIRPSLNFNGPPDPFRGDIPYQLVKTEAKEVMRLLFSGDFTSPSSSVTSESNQQPLGAASYGSNTAPHIYRGGDSLSNLGSPVALDSQLASSNFSKSGEQGGWGITDGSDGGSLRSGDNTEAKLVDDITRPSGTRLIPSHTALQEFAKKSFLLDRTNVLCSLLDNIKTAPWQSRLKALCAIEALIQSDEWRPVATQFFAVNREAILQLTDSVHKSLADKATKVTSILLEFGEVSQSYAPAQIKQQFAAATPAVTDEISIEVSTPKIAESPAPVQTPAEASQSSLDISDLLDFKINSSSTTFTTGSLNPYMILSKPRDPFEFIQAEVMEQQKKS